MNNQILGHRNQNKLTKWTQWVRTNKATVKARTVLSARQTEIHHSAVGVKWWKQCLRKLVLTAVCRMRWKGKRWSRFQSRLKYLQMGPSSVQEIYDASQTLMLAHLRFALVSYKVKLRSFLWTQQTCQVWEAWVWGLGNSKWYIYRACWDSAAGRQGHERGTNQAAAASLGKRKWESEPFLRVTSYISMTTSHCHQYTHVPLKISYA